MSKISKLFVAVIASLILSSCSTVSPSGGSSGGGGGGSDVTTVSVTGVSLDYQELSMNLDDQPRKLNATVSPSDATNRNVTWESSDNNVATVSESGLVTPTGDGIAAITVTTVDGEFTDTCLVTVTDTSDPRYGTLKNPLTIAQALAIAAEECTTQGSHSQKELFIKGVVLTSTGFDTYAKQFYMGDSASATSAERLYIYICNYSSDTQFYQNDEVVLKGGLTNYQGSIQMNTVSGVFARPSLQKVISRGESYARFLETEHVTWSEITYAEPQYQNGTKITFKATCDSGYEIDKVSLSQENTFVKDLTPDSNGVYEITNGNYPLISATTKVAGAVSFTINKSNDSLTTSALTNNKQVTYSTSVGNVVLEWSKGCFNESSYNEFTLPKGSYLKLISLPSGYKISDLKGEFYAGVNLKMYTSDQYYSETSAPPASGQPGYIASEWGTPMESSNYRGLNYVYHVNGTSFFAICHPNYNDYDAKLYNLTIDLVRA